MVPGKPPPPRATGSHSWQDLKGCSFDTGHHRYPRSTNCIWSGKSPTGSEAQKVLSQRSRCAICDLCSSHSRCPRAELHVNWDQVGKRDEGCTHVKESNLHSDRRALRPPPPPHKISSKRNTFLLAGNMKANTRRNNYKLMVVTCGRGVRTEHSCFVISPVHLFEFLKLSP